jgi:AraC-like DNA-binding protein
MLDDLSEDPGERHPGADLLTPLLQGLRLQGVNYQRCLMRAPWHVAFGPQALARFHFVSGGNSRLWTAAMDWVDLAEGDAVLLPRGGFHIMANAPDFPAAEIRRLQTTVLADALQLVDGRGDDPQVEPTDAMFCGTFRFEVDPQHPLLQLMPEVLVLSDLARRDPNVPDLLQAMQREVQRAAAGSEAILARLADALAASMIRAWALSAPAETAGWIAALRCPRVGKVLAAIHREPGARWTVAELASVMGASRSTFTDAFTRTVGESPARYVARVRMAQASRWIGEQGARVSSVAYRLGYESEAAFSRAFKRVMGQPPVQARASRPSG